VLTRKWLRSGGCFLSEQKKDGCNDSYEVCTSIN
jgi:hypothetical protein